MNTGTQGDLEESNPTKKSSPCNVFTCGSGDCPLSFTNTAILARHRLQHYWEHLDDGGQKWFCCDICPRMFKMFQVLEKHRRKHRTQPCLQGVSITFKPTNQKDIYNFHKNQVKQEPIQDIVVKTEPFPVKEEDKSESFGDHVKAEPIDWQTYPNIWNTQSYNPPISSNTSYPEIKSNQPCVKATSLGTNEISKSKINPSSTQFQRQSLLNLTEMRWNFFRSHRDSVEKVSQFICRITKLAVNCEFRCFNLEDALLQCLLENVPPNVRKDILDKQLDLDEAVKLADAANSDIVTKNAEAENNDIVTKHTAPQSSDIVNTSDVETDNLDPVDTDLSDATGRVDDESSGENVDSKYLEFLDTQQIRDNSKNELEEKNQTDNHVNINFFEVNQSDVSAGSTDVQINFRQGHIKLPKTTCLIFCAKCKISFNEHQFKNHKCVRAERRRDSFEVNVETTKSERSTHSVPQIKLSPSCDRTNSQKSQTDISGCNSKRIKLDHSEESLLVQIQTSEGEH